MDTQHQVPLSLATDLTKGDLVLRQSTLADLQERLSAFLEARFAAAHLTDNEFTSEPKVITSRQGNSIPIGHQYHVTSLTNGNGSNEPTILVRDLLKGEEPLLQVNIKTTGLVSKNTEAFATVDGQIDTVTDYALRYIKAYLASSPEDRADENAIIKKLFASRDTLLTADKPFTRWTPHTHGIITETTDGIMLNNFPLYCGDYEYFEPYEDGVIISRGVDGEQDIYELVAIDSYGLEYPMFKGTFDDWLVDSEGLVVQEDAFISRYNNEGEKKVLFEAKVYGELEGGWTMVDGQVVICSVPKTEQHVVPWVDPSKPASTRTDDEVYNTADYILFKLGGREIYNLKTRFYEHENDTTGVEFGTAHMSPAGVIVHEDAEFGHRDQYRSGKEGIEYDWRFYKLTPTGPESVLQSPGEVPIPADDWAPYVVGNELVGIILRKDRSFTLVK